MNRAKQVSIFGHVVLIMQQNRAQPIQPISQLLPKRVGWPRPVRPALKRTLAQDFNSFYIMFYYSFSTTYQKIGDLFCPVTYISKLSYSAFYGNSEPFFFLINCVLLRREHMLKNLNSLSSNGFSVNTLYSYTLGILSQMVFK